MDAIYLDFQKEFNVIDIGVLCHRLKEKGISGSLGLSSTSNVISGVPQGTAFGPLLFLVLIDSMGSRNMEVLLLGFAYDSKTAHPVNNDDDILSMQECMDKIYS